MCKMVPEAPSGESFCKDPGPIMPGRWLVRVIEIIEPQFSLDPLKVGWAGIRKMSCPNRGPDLAQPGMFQQDLARLIRGEQLRQLIGVCCRGEATKDRGE